MELLLIAFLLFGSMLLLGLLGAAVEQLAEREPDTAKTGQRKNAAFYNAMKKAAPRVDNSTKRSY